MPIETQWCPCGLPLHYSNKILREIICGYVRDLGPDIEVKIVGSDIAYLVPRHFIALHGIVAAHLPRIATRYGFKQVPTTTTRNDEEKTP